MCMHTIQNSTKLSSMYAYSNMHYMHSACVQGGPSMHRRLLDLLLVLCVDEHKSARMHNIQHMHTGV